MVDRKTYSRLKEGKRAIYRVDKQTLSRQRIGKRAIYRVDYTAYI